MRYTTHNRTPEGRRAPSTIITRDGVVVWATPAYQWAVSCSMEIGPLLSWMARKEIFCRCVGAECEPTPKQLAEQERRMNPANYVDYSVAR